METYNPTQPMLIGSYRIQEGFFPAYQINKENRSLHSW